MDIFDLLTEGPNSLNQPRKTDLKPKRQTYKERVRDQSQGGERERERERVSLPVSQSIHWLDNAMEYLSITTKGRARRQLAVCIPQVPGSEQLAVGAPRTYCKRGVRVGSHGAVQSRRNHPNRYIPLPVCPCIQPTKVKFLNLPDSHPSTSPLLDKLIQGSVLKSVYLHAKNTLYNSKML